MSLYKEHLKVTQEDQELAQFFMEHECNKTVFKILDRLLLIQQDKVLNASLNEKTFAHIGLLKAEADGAAFIIRKLKDELTRLGASDSGGQNERRNQRK